MKQKHKGAHLLQRFETDKKKSFYKCMIPGCPTFYSQAELVINKLSRCHANCGRELVMTQEIISSKIKKPLCPDCREERKIQKRALSQIPSQGE